MFANTERFAVYQQHFLLSTFSSVIFHLFLYQVLCWNLGFYFMGFNQFEKQTQKIGRG